MSDTSITITSKDPVCVFIDHSNVVIQGKRSFSSIKKASDIDYLRLVEKVLGGRETTEKTVVVGSYRPQKSQDYPQPDDPFWKNLKMNGFTIKLYENKQDREKLVDTTITTRICEFFLTKHNSGTIILVAGDGDYEPPLLAAKERGWNVEVWFWKKGLAHSLKSLATKSQILELGDVTDITNDLPPSSRLRRSPVVRRYENSEDKKKMKSRKKKMKLQKKKKNIQENGGPLISDIYEPDMSQKMISGIPPTYEKKNIQENGDEPQQMISGIPPT